VDLKRKVDNVFEQVVKIGGKAVKTPQEVFGEGYSAYFLILMGICGKSPLILLLI
jgi:hypothetical protein